MLGRRDEGLGVGEMDWGKGKWGGGGGNAR